MSYKIVVDSCGELPEKLRKDGRFENVPLEIFVDDYHIVDDDTFDQQDFLKKVAASPNCPKSTCPSPERYMRAYDCQADHIYAVTLSAKLSGSYNSAELGKNLYIEENGEKLIHVFDSKSASVGETLIAMKIQECEEAGMSFEKVIDAVDAYIAEMDTYFVLESLEALRKNGRLSNLKAFVASALNIKPVMGSTDEGDICQLDQARGVSRALDKMIRVMRRALDKMIRVMLDRVQDCENRILAIAHCNCPKRAVALVEKIQSMARFKDIFVVNTAGISSMYASDGGIIMVV